MGSTLPILTAYLVHRSRNVGRSVGLLLAVSPAPMKLDQRRLRATLIAYRIERTRSARLAPPAQARPDGLVEDCGSILARTADETPVADDNMGEEWSGLLMTDPLLRRLSQLSRSRGQGAAPGSPRRLLPIGPARSHLLGP